MERSRRWYKLPRLFHWGLAGKGFFKRSYHDPKLTNRPPSGTGVASDDLDCLADLFGMDVDRERPSAVAIDPSVKAIRRLRVKGLIEIGQYTDAENVDWPSGSEVRKVGYPVMVARLTKWGEICLSLPTAQDLLKQAREKEAT